MTSIVNSKTFSEHTCIDYLIHSKRYRSRYGAHLLVNLSRSCTLDFYNWKVKIEDLWSAIDQSQERENTRI